MVLNNGILLNLSETSSFSNYILKKDISLVYSDYYYFDVFDEDYSSKNVKNLNLLFSEEMYFSNTEELFQKYDLLYSTGLLDPGGLLTVLSDDEATYDSIDSIIFAKDDIDYYWFDSSILNKLHNFQNFVIPWKYKQEMFQLSYNFPAFELPIEIDVGKVSHSLPLDIQTDIYPPRETVSNIGLEWYVLLAYGVVDIQFARGEEMKVLFNQEYEKTDDTIYLLNYEFYGFHRIDRVLDIEYTPSYEEKNHLNIETDTFTSLYPCIDVEYTKVYELKEPLNIEIKQEPFFNRLINLENLVSAPFNKTLDIEYRKVYNIDEVANYEYRRIYEANDCINYEYIIDRFICDNNINIDLDIIQISRNFKLNFEYRKVYNIDEVVNYEYNVENINKYIPLNIELNPRIISKQYLDIEYRKVYNIDEVVNYEYNVEHLNRNYLIGIEALLSTSFSQYIQLEFFKEYQVYVRGQFFVIPWNYKTKNIQFYHKGTLYKEIPLEYEISNIIVEYINNIEFDSVVLVDEEVNLEFDSKINKDFILSAEAYLEHIEKNNITNMEFRRVLNIDESLNLEVNPTIIGNSINNLEIDINHLDTDFILSLEYLQNISENFPLNIDINHYINTNVDADIEYAIDRISKDYNIDFESFITVDTNNKLDLELFVGTVSKHLHIEFDILDLVYYFIRKGFNILPWVFSDGFGNWDNSLDNKWDKHSTDLTTIENGLYNQLNDKGINIPNVIMFSDNRLENFGTIIKDVQMNDINLQDRFLYYENLDDDHILILGKKKRDVSDVELKVGENLCIWDGKYSSDEPMFNDKIKSQIEEYLISTQFWNQKTGLWETLIDGDHKLFFQIEDGEKTLNTPFIMKIEVNEDCYFSIN